MAHLAQICLDDVGKSRKGIFICGNVCVTFPSAKSGKEYLRIRDSVQERLDVDDIVATESEIRFHCYIDDGSTPDTLEEMVNDLKFYFKFIEDCLEDAGVTDFNVGVTACISV